MSNLSTTVEDRDGAGQESRGPTLKLIDHAISECSGRGVVSASTMMDMLLDIRFALLATSST